MDAFDGQLPAQQLRQQRVAQGGEGAGLVEVGADLAEQRFDELVERGGDLRRGENTVERLESFRRDGVEDGAVCALLELGGGFAE